MANSVKTLLLFVIYIPFFNSQIFNSPAKQALQENNSAGAVIDPKLIG